MSTSTSTAKLSKLHLRQPNDFDGSASKASAWIDSVQIYLLINNMIYDTDPKKIPFTLSFMKEGSATTWASTIAKQALVKIPADFGSWANFLTDFNTSFIYADVKNKAIAWLTTTTVNKTLQLRDYISQFKNNTALSEINNDDTLINFFSQGIPTSLMRRIYSMDTVPTTIQGWYTRAIHFKTQWEKANTVTTCKPYNPYPTQKNHNHSKPTPDTYAMDVYYITFQTSYINPKSIDSYLSGICNQLESHFPNVWNVHESPMVFWALKDTK